jgi:energy-coupling factor transporter transmembrane protein EcfT
MKKFKIKKSDYVLLAGLIFCCVTILFLTYSLNMPMEHVR